MLRKLLFFGLFLFASQSLRATHIVGGELSYRCLGGDQYEVTLQVYRDCANGVPPFDTLAWVAVYDRQWALVNVLKMPFSFHSDTLPVQLPDTCFALPPNVCVHTTTYHDTLSLPFRPGGYTLVYQICCRNQLIRNIHNPLETGTSFTAEVTEKALLECNGGAAFKYWPPVAICVHQPIDFDHSAFDPDGDSLIYRLCTPYVGASLSNYKPEPPGPGPYQEVQWIDPPYNLSNVLGGDPLTIDPKTGRMTGVPDKIGNFVVGVCVDEFRDGLLISSTRRDFQYNVADCSKVVAAFFAPKIVCDGLTVRFENKSDNALFYKWYFQYPQNPPGSISTAQSPLYTYPDTGIYTIVLVAKPGNDLGCPDTFYQTIHLTERHLAADFSFAFTDCSNGLTVAATDLSTDTIWGLKNWQWTLAGPGGQNAMSSEIDPVFTVHDPGQYLLSLIVTAGNGCMDTLQQPFVTPFPDLQNLASQLEICPGDSIFLNPNADTTLTYSWLPIATLNDASAPNPLAKPTATTLYSVLATAPTSGCTATQTVLVKVLDPGGAMATATPPKITIGKSTQLEAIIPGATNITWSPAATLSAADIFNPVATPTDTTLYTATTVLSSGCVVRVSVLVVVIFPDCDEPFVFFPNAFSPNGDSQNDVLKLEGTYIQSVNWIIYNRWGERVFEANSLEDVWDGTFKGKDLPAETYGYYLYVVCPNGRELKKKGNITLLR